MDDPMSYDIDDSDDEPSDFECIECGEELDEDDVCQNEQCVAFGEEPVGGPMTDVDERAWERKQMGITS